MTSHLSNNQAKKAASERAMKARMTKFTRIVMEQGGLCWFCNEEMGSDCTREHLLAQARGGGNERNNLRAAHGECNSAAGHLPVSDKMRLRAVGHSEGRAEMLVLARQMRRADARVAFSGEKTPKPRKHDWTKDDFSWNVAKEKANRVRRAKIKATDSYPQYEGQTLEEYHRAVGIAGAPVK